MSVDEMRAYARRQIAAWPPLTQEQRAQLAALLRPFRPSADQD